MQKIYYDPETGFVCNRYPSCKPIKEDSPYIEVEDDEERKTYVVKTGCAWAVVNGKLAIVNNLNAQNSEEYKQMMKENQLVELEQYLADTDYIITKLNEAKLEDDAEFEVLKAQYSEQLAKRKEVRSKINELRQEIALFK